MNDRNLYDSFVGKGWVIPSEYEDWLFNMGLFETLSILNLRLPTKNSEDERS